MLPFGGKQMFFLKRTKTNHTFGRQKYAKPPGRSKRQKEFANAVCRAKTTSCGRSRPISKRGTRLSFGLIRLLPT